MMFFSREFWSLNPATQAKINHANDVLSNKPKIPKSVGDRSWKQSTLMQSTESSRKKSDVAESTLLRRMITLRKLSNSSGSSRKGSNRRRTEKVSKSEKLYSFGRSFPVILKQIKCLSIDIVRERLIAV